MPPVEDISGTGDALSRLSATHQLSLMRTLVDSAVDAIISHTPGGQLVFYNRSACELLDMTCDDVAEIEPFGWIAPENLRGVTDRLERILLNGQLVFDSALKRGDGTVIPTEVTARRVDTEIGPLIVAVIRDLRERTEAMQQLEYLAYHDALTGLRNRIAFEERLSLAIADSRRYGDLLILAYIDLDKFKPINDRLGHQAGDAMLIEIGKRLMAAVRVQDVVARLGGDEFVVLLERAESVDEIPTIADRLLEAVREPVKTCGVDCAVDASIGFAIFDAETDDPRSLVVKADIAMYSAKKDPARKWCIYEQSMDLTESEPEGG